MTKNLEKKKTNLFWPLLVPKKVGFVLTLIIVSSALATLLQYERQYALSLSSCSANINPKS